MKKLLVSFVFFHLFIFSAHADIASDIETLLSREAHDTHIGIAVARLDTGELIYQRRAHERFTPASTTKLFTAYSALKNLGPDYTFKTQIYFDGANVYLRFTGDPTLTDSDLDSLIAQLKKHKINTIPGDIIIDDTVFSAPYYARGWTVDSLNWGYSAPITSVMLNQNAQEIRLKTAARINQPVAATLVKPQRSVQLKTQVNTVEFETSETLCQLDVDVNDDNQIAMSGCWPITQRNGTVSVAIKNPILMVKANIQDSLKKHQIKHNGTITTGVTPSKLKPIATHESIKLSELLIFVLQESNNFYTESLTKTLGEMRYQIPSFQAGSYAIMQDAFNDADINEEALRLFDGSGASSYTGISPVALTNLLFKANQNAEIRKPFNNALARPCEHGTLQYRMKNLPKTAQFQGKTGTLTSTNTSSLAGTMYNKDGVPLAITIMSNLSSQALADNRVLEDKIVELVYEAGT